MKAPDLLALLECLAGAACDEIAAAPAEEAFEMPTEGVFGSVVDDIDLPIDRALAERVRAEVERHGRGIRRLVMEGSDEPVVLDGQGAIDLFVDPLDGSLNYLQRRRTLGLPYCFVATAMPAVSAPRVGDALAGLVVDLRSGERYLAWRDGERIVSRVDGAPARADATATGFDGRHLYVFDIFHPRTRALLDRVAGADEGWFRNPGGAGYEMVCVGSGQTALFCSSDQKMHELGAAWLFCTGAGAVAKTLDGRALAEVQFDFHATTDVALCATDALWQELARRLE